MCVCGFPFARRQINHSGHNISVVHREKWGKNSNKTKTKGSLLFSHGFHQPHTNTTYTRVPAIDFFATLPILLLLLLPCDIISKKRKKRKEIALKQIIGSCFCFVFSPCTCAEFLLFCCCCSCYSIPERDPPLGSFPWKIAITGFIRYAIGIRILYWKENNKRDRSFSSLSFPVSLFFFFFFFF